LRMAYKIDPTFRRYSWTISIVAIIVPICALGVVITMFAIEVSASQKTSLMLTKMAVDKSWEIMENKPSCIHASAYYVSRESHQMIAKGISNRDENGSGQNVVSRMPCYYVGHKDIPKYCNEIAYFDGEDGENDGEDGENDGEDGENRRSSKFDGKNFVEGVKGMERGIYDLDCTKCLEDHTLVMFEFDEKPSLITALGAAMAYGLPAINLMTVSLIFIFTNAGWMTTEREEAFVKVDGSTKDNSHLACVE